MPNLLKFIEESRIELKLKRKGSWWRFRKGFEAHMRNFNLTNCFEEMEIYKLPPTLVSLD